MGFFKFFKYLGLYRHITFIIENIIYSKTHIAVSMMMVSEIVFPKILSLQQMVFC